MAMTDEEKARRKQANSELLSPDDVRRILNPKVLHEEAERAHANTRAVREYEEMRAKSLDGKLHPSSDQNTRDCVSPTPEPFQVGKRYHSRGYGVAEIISVNDDFIEARYADGRIRKLHPEGDVNRLIGNHYHDLIPNPIDTPAESAGGMTDEEIGEEIGAAFCKIAGSRPWKAASQPEAYRASVQRARELLLPEGAALAANQCHDGYGDEYGNHRCREVDAWKARAERAEAAIERARACIEINLQARPSDDFEKGFDVGLRLAADKLSLTITPARELTVTWEGGK
jgi:hypothetical protein